MPHRQAGAYSENYLAPSAARTASGDSGIWTGFSDSSTLRAQLDVTAFAGTGPTLDVVIEDSLDGTTWNTLVTFSQKTGGGRQVVDYTAPFADRLRARWTIGGTAPSFTFSVLCVSQTAQAG
ncbi:MAG: hypothetical protein M3R38_01830 [Actinomycetota bacterium]|nr:hypothetical protein [Actinomycetota bacterium]